MPKGAKCQKAPNAKERQLPNSAKCQTALNAKERQIQWMCRGGKEGVMVHAAASRSNPLKSHPVTTVKSVARALGPLLLLACQNTADGVDSSPNVTAPTSDIIQLLAQPMPTTCAAAGV